MSSEFSNIKELCERGKDLVVNPLNVGIFGETETPFVVSFQIGSSRAMISLEDFCDMFRIYMIRGGFFGWENSGGMPEPVRKVLSEAAEKIGR